MSSFDELPTTARANTMDIEKYLLSGDGGGEGGGSRQAMEIACGMLSDAGRDWNGHFNVTLRDYRARFTTFKQVANASLHY